MQRLMNLHMLWKFSWQSQTTLCSIVLHSYFPPSIYAYLFILIIYLFDLVFSRTRSQRESVFVSFCCHFIMSANNVDAFTFNRTVWIIQMAKVALIYGPLYNVHTETCLPGRVSISTESQVVASGCPIRRLQGNNAVSSPKCSECFWGNGNKISSKDKGCYTTCVGKVIVSQGKRWCMPGMWDKLVPWWKWCKVAILASLHNRSICTAWPGMSRGLSSRSHCSPYCSFF